MSKQNRIMDNWPDDALREVASLKRQMNELETDIRRGAMDLSNMNRTACTFYVTALQILAGDDTVKGVADAQSFLAYARSIGETWQKEALEAVVERLEEQLLRRRDTLSILDEMEPESYPTGATVVALWLFVQHPGLGRYKTPEAIEELIGKVDQVPGVERKLLYENAREAWSNKTELDKIFD